MFLIFFWASHCAWGKNIHSFYFATLMMYLIYISILQKLCYRKTEEIKRSHILMCAWNWYLCVPENRALSCKKIGKKGSHFVSWNSFEFVVFFILSSLQYFCFHVTTKHVSSTWNILCFEQFFEVWSRTWMMLSACVDIFPVLLSTFCPPSSNLHTYMMMQDGFS